MAARKIKITHDETVRRRIKSGLLLNALQEHALGNKKMEKTQIMAAQILLRKTIPDLSSIEHAIDPNANKLIIEIQDHLSDA